MWRKICLLIFLPISFAYFLSVFIPRVFTDVDESRMRELLTALANAINYENALNALKENDDDETPPKMPETMNQLLGVDFMRENPPINGDLRTSNAKFDCSYHAVPRIAKESKRQPKYQLHVKTNCTYSGDYEVNAKVFGRYAIGSGHFEFWSPDLTVCFDDIKVQETSRKAVTVGKLGYSMGIAILKVTIDGLSVEGMEVSRFKNLLGANFMTALNDVFPRSGFYAAVESDLITQMNKDLEGKTLEDLIGIIKNRNLLAKETLSKADREMEEVGIEVVMGDEEEEEQEEEEEEPPDMEAEEEETTILESEQEEDQKADEKAEEEDNEVGQDEST